VLNDKQLVESLIQQMKIQEKTVKKKVVVDRDTSIRANAITIDEGTTD
jgi:hypothetical protein